MDPLLEPLREALEPQYEAVRLIGSGAMGTVYLFHEIAADRPVAVKVLPGELAASEEGKERFRREAKVTANLRHPNIVPIFTFGETPDLLYYVMQYVDGESLGERIDRDGPLSPDEVTRIMVVISDALAHAHEKGVIHRDIKPGNIVIESRSGRPMLTDFGIAHLIGGAQPPASGLGPAEQRHLRLTSTGMAIGSPFYMAPEQATISADVDLRADFYALGTTAYEALTGTMPYIANSLEDLIEKKAGGKFTPVSARRPDAPQRLALVIEKCLSTAAKNRWANAYEIRDALEAETSRLDGEGAGRRERGVHFWLNVLVAHLVVVGGVVTIAGKVLNLPVSGNLAWVIVLAGLPITSFIAWRFSRSREPADRR
jgi:serine/threonine-protein kinase